MQASGYGGTYVRAELRTYEQYWHGLEGTYFGSGSTLAFKLRDGGTLREAGYLQSKPNNNSYGQLNFTGQHRCVLKIHASYDKYSDEELTEEVKEYYPELLEESDISELEATANNYTTGK